MFDEKERENMNQVGVNTESISSQIINEEAEKLAKEVSNTQNTGNISIGPNGLYNMNYVDNSEVNNSTVNTRVNSAEVNNTINTGINETVNTEAGNTYTNSVKPSNTVNQEYTNNQYNNFKKLHTFIRTTHF